MQRWRADTKAKLRVTRKQRATKGSFEADAKRYLLAVKALATYQTRKKDIGRWVAIFGTKQRDTITASDIRTWRDHWIDAPRSDTDKRPYAASTINHWLRALSNLWTVLDGPRAPNPVREVPEVTEPDALPRAQPIALLKRIIATMATRKGKDKTILRLRVLMYTGLTASQLGRIERADLDLDNRTMLVKRRAKGKGAKPRRLPLMPQAVEAFQALIAADGLGEFSASSMRTSFVRALKKLQVKDPSIGHIRPYDIRHTFGTLVYRATRSREAVRELLSHQDISTTERYTLDGVADVLGAWVDILGSQGTDTDGKP